MALRFGPFQLDPDHRQLMRDGERVPITAKVLDTLVVLVENHERVMEKAELLDRLWPDSIVEEATLVQTISMLRKVIGCSRSGGERYIATIPGRGYQFVGEVQPVERVSPANASPPASPLKNPRPPRWAVALLILAAALLTGWLLRPKPQAAPSSFLRPEPLTSYPGREIFPSFSPEGDRVTFAWEGEGRDNWDIYVKLVGQNALLRLTEHPAQDWSPAWSPDGQQIAFVRRNFDTQTSELIVMPSIGGRGRTILQSPILGGMGIWNMLCGLVTWHPDSEHLIVSHAEEAGQPFFLYAVSTKTGEKRKLTHSDMKLDGDVDPAVSPDGRRLAFRRKIEGWNSSVYVVELNPSIEPVGKPEMVGPGMFSPVWTHDSQEIVMVESPGRPALWRASGSPGALRRVDRPVEAAFPAISRTGNRSAFSVIEVKIDIWQARLKGPPDAKPLIRSTYVDMVPDYSPDGRKIAFASSRSGNREIWVCDRDGSNPMQITDHGLVDADCPAWSPDGSRIIYHANQDSYRDIFVIDATGGTPRRLTHGEGLDVGPSWSSDGKWIYYTSDRSGERCIWKIPSEGGEAVLITTGSHAQESMDGQTLFVDDARALWSMPTVGGPRTRLLDRTWANANFEVGEDGIYLLGNRSLDFYDFKSRAVSEVFATPGPTTWGLSIASNGESVLFSQTVPEEANIMIVDEFR